MARPTIPCPVLVGRAGELDTLTSHLEAARAGRGSVVDETAGALPIYEFTAQLATLEPPPRETQALLGAIVDDQAAKDAFVSMTAGTLSPTDFFSPANLDRAGNQAPD